jgi:hypothetical protein
MQKKWMALLAELEYLNALGQHLIEQNKKLLRQYSQVASGPEMLELAAPTERLEN